MTIGADDQALTGIGPSGDRSTRSFAAMSATLERPDQVVRRLEEIWAIILLVPVVSGVGRYLRLAAAGGAAKPEHLIHDRVLQAAAAATAIVFLLGRAMP